MSKEQKTLKSCYILDRLREWFELYGNQNHQRAEEELHLAIDELYEYQQKDQRIADLEAKLAEKEKYTYYGKEVGEIEQYYENLLAEKEKEIRKKVCDDVIKFMEEDGFDCSDWLDLFNLISGSN